MMSLPASSRKHHLLGPGPARIPPSWSILAQCAPSAVVKATMRIAASPILPIRTTCWDIPLCNHRLCALVPTVAQPWFILWTPTRQFSRRRPSPKTFPSLRLQHLPQSSHRREREPRARPPCLPAPHRSRDSCHPA